MWQIFTNIISETIQAVGVVIGSKDLHRELKKKMNSAERFIQWGLESNNTLEFKEAQAILKTVPIQHGLFQDRIRFLKLKALSNIGIIASKETEMSNFNSRINKKYDTDEYMDEIIYGINNRMKELQAVISAAENGDTAQLKVLLGDKKTQNVRAEELALDARKEYEIVEDSYIMKRSVKENKHSEISNFKSVLGTEIHELQEEIANIIIEIDKLGESVSDAEREVVEEEKKVINEKLQLIVSKLKKEGIPVSK